MASLAEDVNVDELRRRARRRLVGAIVLALGAAVIVPMLLESEPRPLGEDVAVRIPPVDDGKFVNRLNAPPGTSGAASTPGSAGDHAQSGPDAPGKSPDATAGAAPSKPAAASAPGASTPGAATSARSPSGGDSSTAAVTTAPSANGAAEASAGATAANVASAGSAAANGGRPKYDTRLSPGAPSVAAPSGAPVATAVPASSAPSAAGSTAGGAGAHATGGAPAHSSAAATHSASDAGAAKAAPAHGGYAVQLAAFSDDKGANALAGRLRRAGYSAYTEPLKTSKGTLWRVRVGPYGSRESASLARDRLKAEGQNGIVASAR